LHLCYAKAAYCNTGSSAKLHSRTAVERTIIWPADGAQRAASLVSFAFNPFRNVEVCAQDVIYPYDAACSVELVARDGKYEQAQQRHRRG
jgi:hypothetical protein